MLAEALTALTSAGATALVTAMVTDGWESVRARAARLLGRGDAAETQQAATRLEQSRAALAASGVGLERALAAHEIAWRARLADLLERDPGAEQELRILVADLQVQGKAAGRVEQRAVAHDRAQQAVLGQGVQNVAFGDHRGPGASPG